ncbi:MAG: SpoVR family protein [Planctomycetota bacterium]|nr:SpoVR family protein [Planctomycetota bacterium]
MTAVSKRDTGKKQDHFLFEDSEWTFETIERTYAAIEEIALEDLGLDIYPNQIEIISSEQMLDAYCSVGMPLTYHHWSFGKRFVYEEELYRKGYQGLAYEIVINSSPCISYYMEKNTMAMQTLVLAHAALGHNHFFKNNYLFRQWTDAEAILDYFVFAKDYIAKCEERHGVGTVEEVLDAAHALMDQGVFRYRRQPRLSQRDREEREEARQTYEEQTYNDLWRTLPESAASREDPCAAEKELAERKRQLKLPEENLHYFIEKNSPALEPWQREILHIVRGLAQYFYPQKQTKVMNEGCATFVHHYLVNALFDKGLITEGALLEILHSHSNVVFQPGFDDPRYSGINPYALGFAMMQDIKRICSEPAEEDRDWFPEIAGCGDWRGVLKEAWVNYRDESFIRQFLSPRLVRELKLFRVTNEARDNYAEVAAIHNERGYREVIDALARAYDLSETEPDIQVADVDLKGDRELILRHKVRDAVPLAERSRDEVVGHIRQLWGYDVRLEGFDAETEKKLYDTVATGTPESDEE